MSPAYGKDCFQCKKIGHFSAYCRSNRNNQQHGHTPSREPRCQREMEQDDNGDDWIFSLNHNEVVIKFTDSVTKVKGTKNVMFDEIELSRVLVDLKVQENCTPVPNNGHPLHKLRFKLDSGAHGNLTPISMCKSLFPGLPHDVLRKSIDERVTLVAYNKQEIKQPGQCCSNVSNPSTGKSKTCKFFVVGDCCNPTIGLHNSIALNLLSVNVPFTGRWTDKSCSLRTDNIDVEEISKEKLTHDFILKKYKKLFTGIGCFKSAPAEIKLKENAVLVQKPLRRIPVAMRDKFQEEINNMVKAGILTKLDKNQAPEWLNSFVVVRKPSGKLRVCLDPTDLNPHIICPVFNSNISDDIVHKLCKVKYMARFDALMGFFRVPSDKNSKLLSAMLTPIGIFIYNVITMGLTNANDIFEQCLHDILHGLDGVFNIADDILVIGETYAEFKDNVIRFLDQCVEKDLHLNADKFKLDCDTVTFFGHLLTKDGMKRDPKKVKDI